HLSGLELVKPVPVETLLEIVGDRVWEKPALTRALEQLFDRLGPRISFRRPLAEDEPAKRDLLAWCYQQALTYSQPLPPVFSRADQMLAAEFIDPRWVGERAVARLDELKLGDEAVLRILGMILDGVVRAPEQARNCRSVKAAAELLNPA